MFQISVSDPNVLLNNNGLTAINIAAKNPATSNKRCDNQRLKDLGYTFSYPSYQEGYREQLND